MGLKVMIVDDSLFMRNLLKNHISKEENVTIVGEGVDGQDAVNKFESLTPDVIFMDIMMPNLNGLEALKQIKGKNPNITVVMCTSVGQEKIIAEAVEAGASEFIVKPFKPEDVHEVIVKYNK